MVRGTIGDLESSIGAIGGYPGLLGLIRVPRLLQVGSLGIWMHGDFQNQVPVRCTVRDRIETQKVQIPSC